MSHRRESDGGVKLWSLRRRRVVERIDKAHMSSVLKVDRSIEGHHVITQGKDGTIRVWDGTTLQPITDLTTGSRHFCQFSLIRWPVQDRGGSLLGNHTLLTPCDDPSVLHLHDLRNGYSSIKSVVSTLSPDSAHRRGMVMCCQLVGAGDAAPRVVAGYEDGSLCIFDLRRIEKGSNNSIISHGIISSAKLHSEPVICCDVARSGHMGISGSADNSVVIWRDDVGTQNGVRNLVINDNITLGTKGTACIKLRQDKKLFAAGSWDGGLRLCSWPGSKPLAELLCHEMTVNSIDFSEDGWLCAGSKDSRISLWNVYRSSS